jgi:two-component system, chemotaxis family, protein-glutamate methylesterase/glutaminase
MSSVIREGQAPSLKPVAPAAPGTTMRPGYAVGFAASCGGLAALTRVLSALPADFAAPVLVVLHLDPNHRSWLTEILSQRLALAVAPVREGEPLLAGRVYVAPANQHLLARGDGTLALTGEARVQYSRPSGDVLFASLAEVWGPRAIAVVLTGRGRDGADGVLAIQRRGGTVIVQDEASAECFDMPDAAIRTGAASRVLPLEAIAPALVELTAGGIV